MAVFRVEKSKDYTVMSNHHLRNENLSLRAKGLLSQILSLPEDWDYTIAGLAKINKEGKDAVRAAVQELEKAGYIERRQKMDSGGKFSGNEYVVYESPRSVSPLSENPTTVLPTTEKPSTEKPLTENPTQLNKDKSSKDTALRMKAYYPEWGCGIDYTRDKNRPVGYKVRHGGELWKLRTEHTSQKGWEPGAVGTESLWEQVNETHTGTVDDPIPYDGNMALVNGLYYHQNGIIYLCNRDTVNPVYNPLADLVDIYVVKV